MTRELAASACLFAACNGSSGTTPMHAGSGGTATGGADATGGASPETGGASATGGVAPTTGGASATGGGSPATGGADATGGVSSATGGNPAATGGTSSGGGPQRMPSALVFSRTQGYRHESIGAGVRALTELGTERGWQVTATEDATKFSDESLEAFNVVVFLSTTGDVLDGEQQAAFERFIRAGNGYVGIHAASDTEYDWPWYGQLVGAYFKGHPEVQTASVVVEDATHPSTAHLSGNWMRRDEWYGFRSNPRDRVQVLLRLDESSYMAGEGSMGDDHPIAWCHDFEEGRAFYTGLGHTSESYSEAPFLEHIAGGIEWAARAREIRD